MKISDALKSNMSYEDKVHLACKKLPATFLQHWAVDCAESVLHIYEQEHPNNATVRNCIDVAKQVLQGKLDKDAAISAAYAAAYAANAAANAAANDAAISAAYAARSAANAANSAADAAYSAANSAAYAAANADNSVNAVKNKQQQKQLNIELLLKQVEIFESPLYLAMQEGELLDENEVMKEV